MKEPCEWYAATQKRGKYDVSFEGTDYIFSAMVFETLGAINTEGEELLRMLFRCAAKRMGREFTSYCGQAWARISCDLHTHAHTRTHTHTHICACVSAHGGTHNAHT